MASLAGCTTEAPPPPPTPPPVALPPRPVALQPYFTQTGLASFYGGRQDGKTTADGESFDKDGFTAAHRTLSFGTVVRVTDLDNGRMVKVRINDRGPHVKGRIIDLSAAAASALGMRHDGITRVRVEAFKEDQGAG